MGRPKNIRARLYKAILRGILSVAWVFSALAVLSTVFTVVPDLWNSTVTGKYFRFFYT